MKLLTFWKNKFRKCLFRLQSKKYIIIYFELQPFWLPIKILHANDLLHARKLIKNTYVDFDQFGNVKLRFCEKDTKSLRNHNLRYVLFSNGQIYGGDFAKFCSLLKIYELYIGTSALLFTFLTPHHTFCYFFSSSDRQISRNFVPSPLKIATVFRGRSHIWFFNKTFEMGFKLKQFSKVYL